MRTARMFVLCWMFSSMALGQNAAQRIEQYEAEAEVLNSPSCVLFDANLIESNDKKGVLSHSRSVGRRVVGLKGEVRVDVRVTVTDLNSDAERIEFEHYICFDPKNYLHGLRPFGGRLTVFDLEKSLKEGIEPIAPHGFNSPFQVAIGGSLRFKHRSNRIHKISAVDTLENAVKPAGELKAKGIRTFKFLEGTPWAITAWKSVINPRRFDFDQLVLKNGNEFGEDHLPNWTDLKNPKQYVKDWNVVGSGSVDWTAVENIGILPARVVCHFYGIPKIDDRETDFEVNYFGYEFDIKTLEKLFDRKRFNDADIMQDFPIESILDQAEAAKKAIAKKSIKKPNRR